MKREPIVSIEDPALVGNYPILEIQDASSSDDGTFLVNGILFLSYGEELDLYGQRQSEPMNLEFSFKDARNRREALQQSASEIEKLANSLSLIARLLRDVD